MAYNSFINKQVGIQSPTFRFEKDRANATIVSGDGLGQFQFYGFDGTSYLLTSAIQSTSSGTIAANRIGSNLEFYTHPDSVTASTQRMVIESTGQLQINDPSSNVATLFVTNNQSTPNINLRTANATASNAPHMHFTRSRAGTADVAASDDLGRFEYYGFQGGTARQAAQVSAVAQTVNGTNAVSGYLSFSTVPTTYAAMAERVRIAADGNVIINSPVSGDALTIAGSNLNFSSTTQRIKGNMDTPTPYIDRLCIQSNGANMDTSPLIIPSGANTIASIVVSNNSNPTNSGFGQLQIDNASVKLISGALGTGTALPMSIRMGMVNEAIGISTNRNVTISAPVSGVALTVNQTTASSAIGTSQTFGGAGSIQNIQTSNDVQPVYYNVYKRRTGGTVSNGDVIHQINSFAQNAGVDYTATLTRSVATTVGAGFVAGTLDWWTTSSAGVTSQRMVLSADGFVTINAPAVTGQALTINAFAGTANYAFASQAAVSGGLFQAGRFLNSSTTAGSGSRLDVACNQQAVSTGGEAFTRYINEGVAAYSVGIRPATGQFVMSSGSTLAAAPFLTFGSPSQINLPFQASFHAWISTAQNNVTGAGTYYNVIFQTERFDVSSSYNNTTGVFTAPATGKYLFTSQLEFTGITAAMTWGDMGFQVNGTAFVGGLSYINVGAAAVIGTFISLQNTCIMSLSAGDTVVVRTRILNGAGDTADLAVATSSFFAGQLLS